MLQSNGTFYWPAQENHGKQSVQGTAMAATTEGAAPCKLLVWVMFLNTYGSLELVLTGHLSVKDLQSFK